MSPIIVLHRQLETRPDDVAFLANQDAWTYGRLATASEHLAWALLRRGVRAADRVALHMESRPEMAIAYYACFRIGAIAAPLNIMPEAVEPESRSGVPDAGKKGEMTMNQTTTSAPTRVEVAEVLKRIADGWRNGNGEEFAAGFTPDAHFVAFDGTVLRGSRAIGRFHQQAFDTHLKGTRLVVSIEDVVVLGDEATLVFTSGHIERGGGRAGDLTGASVETELFIRQDGEVLMRAFHNCRKRPIKDGRSAEVWMAFDRAWKEYAPE